MPPFCAPAPSYLLSEPTPVSAALPEDHEQDERARIVASIVTALTDAEAAATEQNNPNNPEHQHLLATQAYTSLCFDFPIVSTSALAALASVFRSSHLDVGKPIFPITERFTSGLRYLVSIELTKQSTLGGAVATTEVADTESEGGDSKERCIQLFMLCGCVFLLAPAVRLSVALKDNGDSLNDFLDAFDPSSVDGLQQECHPDDSAATSNSGLDRNIRSGDDEVLVETEIHDSVIYDDVATELDDDDSDWEALETFTPSEVAIPQLPAIPSHERSGWSNVMGKVALFTAMVPSEVINTSIWEELQLTDHLIQALKSMRLLGIKETEADVITIATLYSELLSDHLLSHWSSSSSEISGVVSALMVLCEATGDKKQRNLPNPATGCSSKKSWEFLVLSTIAKLCSKVGGYPARKISLGNTCSVPTKQGASKASREHSSLPSPTFVRNLWQSVFPSMQFLQVQLTESLTESGSFSQLEMVLWILCFFVKCAPGNANLRAILLEGGIFRTALQLFVKVGVDSQMEPLRHFLLLSMASCPALAEFAAKVPAFRAAVAAPNLLVEGSYTKAHAIIWPLLLRAAYWQSSTNRSPAGYSNQFKSSEAEDTVVRTFNGTLEALADDTIRKNPASFLRDLVWFQWFLLLLEEAASGSPGSTCKLWQQGSTLDICINQCQVALGNIFVNVSEVASSVSLPSLQRASSKKSEDPDGNPESSGLCVEDSITCLDDESKDRSELTAPETELITVQDKLKELLPSILLQLKRLSVLTKGNLGAKID